MGEVAVCRGNEVRWASFLQINVRKRSSVVVVASYEVCNIIRKKYDNTILRLKFFWKKKIIGTENILVDKILFIRGLETWNKIFITGVMARNTISGYVSTSGV